MKITNSVEKNGYPQLIQDCNASTIKEIIERVLHSITGKFDSAILVIDFRTVLRAMLIAGVLAVLLACAGTAAGVVTWVVDDDGGVEYR